VSDNHIDQSVDDAGDRIPDLFRAHAAARLRGDAAEACRIARRFTEGQRRAHLVFVQSLFAGVIVDRLGTRPDPHDLAEITKGLHDKHFDQNGTAGFVALRAEAMVRALFGEEHLLFEIPYAEQPGYMWAVMGELAGPDLTDAELAEHFRTAEAFLRESVGGASASLAELFDPGVEAPTTTSDEQAEPELAHREPGEAEADHAADGRTTADALTRKEAQ
jgi:hypothetical protein